MLTVAGAARPGRGDGSASVSYLCADAGYLLAIGAIVIDSGSTQCLWSAL